MPAPDPLFTTTHWSVVLSARDAENGDALEKLCRNAASTWSQSGHLEGRSFKRRRTVLALPTTASFAIYLAQFHLIRPVFHVYSVICQFNN